MVELRKRKTPRPVAESKSKVSKTTKRATDSSQVKKASTAKTASSQIEVGSEINLDDFGGQVHKSDGTSTTLASLVQASKEGVVLFTYPAASTPGCTTQAQLFRDNYTLLTSTGLDIYGLSKDSFNANTKFKEKQNLPYELLCDPKFTLIGAIGLKKNPSGTQRGVFAVNKAGKILLMEAGGPAATAEAVKKLVQA